MNLLRRPELPATALAALVVAGSVVLAALGRPIPELLTAIGIAAAGGALGATLPRDPAFPAPAAAPVAVNAPAPAVASAVGDAPAPAVASAVGDAPRTIASSVPGVFTTPAAPPTAAAPAAPTPPPAAPVT